MKSSVISLGIVSLLLLVDRSKAACGPKVGKKPCPAPYGLEAALEVQGEKHTRWCCDQQEHCKKLTFHYLRTVIHAY